MPDVAVHTTSQKLLSGLSAGEKFFSLLTALALGVGSLALVQMFLMQPPAYPDFLVGAITWDAATKFQDLASFPAFLLGCLTGGAISIRFFWQISSVKPAAYRQSLVTTLTWWLVPVAIGAGGLLSIYPNSESFAILVGLAGIVLTLLAVRIHAMRGAAMPDQLALGVVAVMLISLAPFAFATVIDRLPIFAEVTRHTAITKLTVVFLIGASVYFLYLCKAGDAAVNQYLPKMLLGAQLGIAPFYLLILPDLFTSSEPAITTTKWLWWLSASLVAIAVVDVVIRYRKYSPHHSMDWVQLLSPAALFATTILLRNGQTMFPHVPADDYHFGESLLGWWSFSEFGKIPYLDYLPPHGIFGDDIGGYLSLIFYDGTAATLAEADRLAATLTMLGAFWALRYYTKSLGLAYTSILFFGLISGNLLFLFLVPFFCLWLNADRNLSPRAWLWIWLFTATILVLAVPPQGILVIAATMPVVAQYLYWYRDLYRAKSLEWGRDALILILLVGALASTSIPAMLHGAIRYVLENGTINQIAYGVPWSWSWGGVEQDHGKALLAMVLEVLRMSWVWVPLLAASLIVVMLKQMERRAYLIGVALPVFLFASLMTPYSMGRIDPAAMSRPGLLSNFAWAILLPILLTPLLASRGRAVLAVSIAFVCAGLGLASVNKEGFASVLEKNRIENLWSGAEHGLKNFGMGDVDPTHVARLMRVNSFLSTHLAPREVYLDLTGHNADYMYFDRPPPVATTAPYNLAPIEQQRRAVVQLNKSVPRIALLEADNINHDGGGMALRTHLLYRFVLDHYTAEIHDGYVYGFTKEYDATRSPISFEIRDLTDQNWEHGVSRAESAIVIRDAVTVRFLQVGDVLRLPDNHARKITRVWPEGSAIWFDGPRIDANAFKGGRSYQVEIGEARKLDLSMQLMSYVFAVPDLRQVPVAWGRSSASLESAMAPVINLGASIGQHDLVAQGDGFKVIGGDPYLVFDLTDQLVSGKAAGLLKFDFVCDGPPNPRMQIFWWGDAMQGAEPSNSLNFTSHNGSVIIPLDAYPSWLETKHVKGIRVDVEPADGCRSISVRNVVLSQRTNL